MSSAHRRSFSHPSSARWQGVRATLLREESP
jgi:hypothetical protein